MEDFCLRHIGKTWNEVSYGDIVDFFQNQQPEESTTLEIKSATGTNAENIKDRMLNNVAKGISAMLNSEGGLFIFGGAAENKGKDNNGFLKDLNPVPVHALMAKDHVISTLNGAISPFPKSLELKIIRDNQENPTSVVYLFNVQKSLHPPHQFNKSTYYIRLDGQNKPAPHYLIEALFRQVQYPNLEANFSIYTVSYFYDIQHEAITLNVHCNINIANKSNFITEPHLFFAFFIKSNAIDIVTENVSNRHYYDSRDNKEHSQYYRLIYGIPYRKDLRFSLTFKEKQDPGIQLDLYVSGDHAPTKLSRYKIVIPEFDKTCSFRKEHHQLNYKGERNYVCLKKDEQYSLEVEFENELLSNI